MVSKKKQEEKKSTTGWLYGFFNGQTNSGDYCTADQCFLNNPQPFSTTSLIPPINTDYTVQHIEVNNSTYINQILESIKFAKLFPPELIQLMIDAASRGFFTSILLTLVNEGISDYMKGFDSHPNHIYWINQVIRTLLLLALGSSPNTTVATLLMAVVLNACCGMSKEKSNYISTGISLGINLLGKSTDLMEASITISTSVGFSILGGHLAKSGYNYVRDTFFSNETEKHETIKDMNGEIEDRTYNLQ